MIYWMRTINFRSLGFITLLLRGSLKTIETLSKRRCLLLTNPRSSDCMKMLILPVE